MVKTSVKVKVYRRSLNKGMEERLQAVVSQAEADGEKWHIIIHGNNATTVPTENGNVPTVAKQMKDVHDEVVNGVIDYNCVACGKENLDKDTIGINKKLLGLDIVNFYCLDCLAEYLDCTVQELLDKIEEFKEEGCKLFDGK